MKGTIFYKMTGSGNDFVMLDGRFTTPAEWPAARIVEVCHRRLGVGADGLVILTPEGSAGVRMIFFNCDGSRAAMCGNAALCSTRLSAYLELAPATGMTLVTDAGSFPTRCVGSGAEAALNLPGFEAPRPVPEIVRRPGEQAMSLATVGVPHLVVIVEDIERAGLMDRGRELRFDRWTGSEGANVNFLSRPEAGTDEWPIRTFERGVEGETLACGTGAVAAAVAAAEVAGASLPLTVRTRSGRDLVVAANRSNGQVADVWLTGEGRLVFVGTL